MKQYIWQRPEWPNFTWESSELLDLLGQARKAQGQVLAKASFVGLDVQAKLMVDEAFTTAAIEGEQIDRSSIRSSVARRLGLPTSGLAREQRHIDGLVEILFDATTKYQVPLNTKRLHGWHAALFPSGYSGMHKIEVGQWRKSSLPMQVISGPIGKEKIHFEAPPSNQIKTEMKLFIDWVKSSEKTVDGVIRAGLAQLWFVTIHPIEDGNGRIARAITDMLLAQDERTGLRLYSLSTQIVEERDRYYEVLESSQKQGMDATMWLSWFLQMYCRAIAKSQIEIDRALLIAKFWQRHSKIELNDRQVKVLQRLLEAEPQGFEGGISNRKYVSLTKVSRETAKRDLSDLEEKGILRRNEGRGRSVTYSINLGELEDV